MQENNLLNQVTFVRKKYEEIAKVTGEGFNIFQILKIDSKEVRMHSAFLAELLNPKGSHGLKSEFLKAFVKYFEIDDFNEIDLMNCNVKAEEYIGKVNQEYSEGGRLDIVIEAGLNKVIVIENKIYASEQYNWLKRYKSSYKNPQIFYLTLNGTEPSIKNIGDFKVNEDFKCISYSNDIIKWLEICREKSVVFPMLRECISQYINLLKELTHQSTSKIQEMEIQKLILDSGEMFKSAEIIASSLDKIRADIYQNCRKELFESWEKKYGSKGVEIFMFNGYNFYIKPSDESKYFHFDLFPMKNQKMEVANDIELILFRTIAKEFEGRSNVDFWHNNNYTVWVRSKYNFENIEFVKYKVLIDDRSEWLNDIIKEGEDFINYIVQRLKGMNNSDIILNSRYI